MWKASLKFYGVISIAAFVNCVQRRGIACKVGIFDICNQEKQPVTAPPRDKDFLYFQKAGDIEKITIPKDGWLAQISLIDECSIRKNRDDIVEIQGKNNESVTVNMRTLEITISALDGIGKMLITLNITKDGASIANETISTNYGIDQFSPLVSTKVNANNGEEDDVTIYSSCAAIAFYRETDAPPGISAKVWRRRAANVDIHILGYENTTVYERRDSGDVYSIRNGSDVWEEMYVQPAGLLIRAKNHLGTLYFHPNRPVQVNAWNGTRVSGSPFGKKFGRIIEENVTREVTFGSSDCGTLKVAYHSGSRKLITRARPPMLYIVDEDKVLKVEPHKSIYWRSSRGSVKVDLEKRSVLMKDFTNGSTASYHTLANETKALTGAAGSVEHFDEGFDEDFVFVDDNNESQRFQQPRSSFTWIMNLEMGSLDFPTYLFMQELRFISAKEAIANVTYTGSGFDVKDAEAGEMLAYCRHYAKLAGSGAETVEVYRESFDEFGSLTPATFFLKNSPGSVRMRDNLAIVRGHSGVVTISPFKIDVD